MRGGVPYPGAVLGEAWHDTGGSSQLDGEETWQRSSVCTREEGERDLDKERGKRGNQGGFSVHHPQAELTVARVMAEARR